MSDLNIELMHTFATMYTKEELIDMAYVAGRQDARKEIAETNGGDDKVYRLAYPDGSFHDELYRKVGYARNARSNMWYRPEAKDLKVQELKGVWVDVS